ncbi:hypothetical protein [uncultured Lutibacter sp.]|uniref:hypothetical protein n=1 Tax=uncultured Lutibacter sp. TaxID=437739 RepID=UPI002608B56E|nr:hypothetical protein [uncultured Lutibacter sp.]
MGAVACEDDETVDPEKTIGKVGNYWGMYVDNNDAGDVTITQNIDGNIIASFSYDGSTHNVEGKITSNGIYDYVYSNGDRSKPFTLVKFDAKVGDKWEYNVGDKKVVRKVVKKSTTDDVEYGFYYVKTIDVEETIPTGTMVNGSSSEIKKILWKFNHKFGFIEADVTKTDNSVSKVTSLTNAGD